jgi:flagellar protein FliO/FliZ
MTQSLILIGLFLAVLVSLPFLIERIKKHYGLGPIGPSGASRVVSALALGPQQKVVTVEVGPSHARVWLVLGVTPQSIQCLHTLPAESATAVPAVTSVGADMLGPEAKV